MLPAQFAKTILIVEDDAEVHDTIAGFLKDAGHAVQIARNGQEALNYLHDNSPPDLILLDLAMPILNGWEFRRRQLAEPELAAIPVVVLSALHPTATRPDVLGKVGYLPKPPATEELLSVIQRFALGRKPGILVVEDEPSVLYMLDTFLQQQGFSTHLARNGKEALDLYAQGRGAIDLVLMDVQMPVLDGVQTLVELKKLNPQLCVVMMSGYLGDYSREDLLARGAAHVLDKPIQNFPETMQLLWNLATAAP